MYPSASPRRTLGSRGNKTRCFPWGQSLSADYITNPAVEEILYMPLKYPSVLLCYTLASKQASRVEGLAAPPCEGPVCKITDRLSLN